MHRALLATAALLLVLLAALRPVAATPIPDSAWTVSHYKGQRLSHMTPEQPDEPHWSQRFDFIDFRSPARDGPVFLFLGGEASVAFFRFQEQLMLHEAQHRGALVLALEHRFYGESLPLPDVSDASLKLLDARQALHDSHRFLAWATTERFHFAARPQVVVWGCSYSGALAAWWAGEFPGEAAGVVAPSGPLVAQAEFDSFFHLYGEAAGAKCAQATAAAWQATVAASAAKRAAAFNSCGPLDAEEDALIYSYAVTNTERTSHSFDQEYLFE